MTENRFQEPRFVKQSNSFQRSRTTNHKKSAFGGNLEESKEKKWRALVVCATLLSLSAGLALKTPCLLRPWGPPEYIQYTTVCYNDLQPLYGLRGLDQRRVPYVEEKSYEYPALIALEMWAASYFSRSHVSFFWANVPFLAAFAILASLALFEATKPRFKRTLLFALGPPLVFYSFHNWDLLAVAPLALAAWAWARGELGRSGLFVGLGAAAKLFPAYGLPALAVASLGENRRLWRAVAFTAAAVASWSAVNTPLVVLELLKDNSIDGWLGVFRFHSRRFPDFGTVWYWWAEWSANSGHHSAYRSSIILLAWTIAGAASAAFALRLRRSGRACKRSPIVVAGAFLVGAIGLVAVENSTLLAQGPTSSTYKSFVDSVSLGIFATGTIVLVGHQLLSKRDPWATFAGIVCLFLLVSKVHSPQYALWMLMFFVVVETPWHLVAAYVVSDAVLLASGFWWFADSPTLGPSGWRSVFIVSVYTRALALGGLLVWYAIAGRDLIRLGSADAALD